MRGVRQVSCRLAGQQSLTQPLYGTPEHLCGCMSPHRPTSALDVGGTRAVAWETWEHEEHSVALSLLDWRHHQRSAHLQMCPHHALTSSCADMCSLALPC